MSKIIIPAKPSWMITLIVDSSNQVQINVEDLTVEKAAALGLNVRGRTMNQLELALILNNIVSSTLAGTLGAALNAQKKNDSNS